MTPPSSTAAASAVPGGWFRIPNRAADWLATIGPTAFCIFATLCRLADSDGTCVIGNGTIGKRCKVKERAVRAAMATLRNAGLIESETRAKQSGATAANRYRVLYEPTRGEAVSTDRGGIMAPGAPAPECPHPRHLGTGTPRHLDAPPLSEDPLVTHTTPGYARESPNGHHSRNGTAYPPAFLAFWESYPRKTCKKAALKAWRAALRDVQLERRCDEAAAGALLSQSAEAFAASDRGRAEARYIPHPATWLNAGTWADDPAEWSDRKSANGKPKLKYL